MAPKRDDDWRSTERPGSVKKWTKEMSGRTLEEKDWKKDSIANRREGRNQTSTSIAEERKGGKNINAGIHNPLTRSQTRASTGMTLNAVQTLWSTEYVK